MKKALIVILILLILTCFAVTFIYIVVLGSGHALFKGTNGAFLFVISILILPIIVIYRTLNREKPNSYNPEVSDIWNRFDALIHSLENRSEQQIVKELRHSRRFANSLPDGWFGFLKSFNQAIEKYQCKLTSTELLDAEDIVCRIENIINRANS